MLLAQYYAWHQRKLHCGLQAVIEYCEVIPAATCGFFLLL